MTTVISISPAAVYTGDAVIILGTLFTGATSVKFGGVNASAYVVLDDNTIIAIVAAGGATGLVAVVSPGGAASLAGFTFLGPRPGVVKVQMPNSPPYPDGAAPADDDLVWVTDVATNTLRKAPISSLPFSGGGGDGETITAVPSPFFVYPGSDNYSYDAGTNSVTIRDARLLNKINYPVATTQYGGGEFADNLITYNPIDPDDDTVGNVVISGFQLDANAHITITVPGDRDVVSDSVYAQLLADVKLLKQIAAPFIPTALGPNGAKRFWGLPADTIPAGWQEYVPMRGKMPIAQDPADVYDADDNPTGLSRAIGTTGGSKSLELEMENLPAEGIKIEVRTGHLYGGGGNSGAVQAIGHDTGTGAPDQTISEETTPAIGEGVPIESLNPYRIVMWIEFIGIV